MTKSLTNRLSLSLIFGVGLILALMSLISQLGSALPTAQAAAGFNCLANQIDCVQPVDGRAGIASSQAQPDLYIFKGGPPQATSGHLITYTLVVVNLGPVPATNLLITDTLPTGANYVSGGTRIGNMVKWTLPTLAADGGAGRMTFVVTATETITNNDYGVQADGGVSTIGDWVIVTEIVDTIIPGQGNGPQILPGGSATTQQNKDFSVYLFNHRHVPPVYEIYLESLTTSGLIYRICPPTTAGNPVITDQNGNGLFNCLVSTAIPPGNYRLFSTEAGLTTVIAQFEIVTVLPGEAPFIQIQGGNTLVANSQVEITLSNHAIADEDFRLYFDDGISETEITNGPVAAEPAPTLLWTVPLSAASACPPFGSPCRIFSRSENPTASDPYAETEIYVVAPELTITKTAPATVNAGDPITYTLTVANSGTTTATNLLITDTLPAGATYLSGGSHTGDVISWSVPNLPVSATTQVSFVVTASQTIVNSDYSVRADGGLIALGSDPVETIVLPNDNGLLRRVFLPLVLKP